jgi:hypothetical protein
MLFPQTKSLAGSAGVALIGDLDVSEHCGHFPGERVEIEATLPEPGPSCGRLADPFGSPARVDVATVSRHHVGDRAQPRMGEPVKVGQASQQRLSQRVAAGCPPQIRERPRRQRPQSAFGPMGVDGGDMTTSHRSSQCDLSR